MTEPLNIVGALVESLIPISRSVATFLTRCERFLPEMEPSEISSERLLARVGDGWRKGRHGLAAAFRGMSFLEWDSGDAIDQHVSRLEQRLARAVLQAWPTGKADADGEHRVGRRPDVLALACQLLANPDAPYTLKIIRFAAVSALRALYGVTNDAACLEELRDSYTKLASRFEPPKQRRRVRRPDKGAAPFLLDLLCMSNLVYRAALDENLQAYYDGFSKYPLGVDPKQKVRHFAKAGDWPEIHGDLPDFPSLLTLAFSQPTAVPGFDTITGGLVAAMPGGLITLLAGPPGSGKTTLCMSIASRMSELGCQVSYISTEERTNWLSAKHTAAVGPKYLAAAIWPYAQPQGLSTDLTFHEAETLDTFEEVSNNLRENYKPPKAAPERAKPGQIYLPHPCVVVIDSITVLVEGDDGVAANSTTTREHGLPQAPSEQGSPQTHDSANPTGRSAESPRRRLARALNQLRDSGICVFLVGDRRQLADDKMAYLVDNVFALDFEEEGSKRHPVRIFELQKTRLQTSYRGRHVLHLSRFEGCTISPSLHAVLARSSKRRFEYPHEKRAILLAYEHDRQLTLDKQLSLSIEESDDETNSEEEKQRIKAITVKNRTHSLVYGWGTTGKSRFALGLALEPKYSVVDKHRFKERMSERLARGRIRRGTKVRPPPLPVEREWLANSRVLILSFLHDHSYYERLFEEMMLHRFGIEQAPTEAIHVLHLYPGYLDPETLLARIRRTLKAAHLEGRPFTSIVLDGIHNMLLQFPLFARDPLLLPTIFKALRSEHLDIVSTFTFFMIAGGAAVAGDSAGFGITSDEARRLFQQLLASQCDYSFLVERAPGAGLNGRVKIMRISAVAGMGKERDEFFWDPKVFRGDFGQGLASD